MRRLRRLKPTVVMPSRYIRVVSEEEEVKKWPNLTCQRVENY